MTDRNSRPARKVGIADHLWETYEEMAQQMGSDRDALINQALFVFARLNGFLEVARTGRSATAGGGSKFVPPVAQSFAGGASAKALPPSQEDTPLPGPARREVAERVRETAAELERLIKGKSDEPREALDEEPRPEDSGMDMAADDEPEADDEPRAGAEPRTGDEPLHAESAGDALLLSLDDAEPRTIAKERFVIGRGKHCDLVINSGKVSREHAVIFREGDDFFIEDLGSSNGTWFNKQRIKRRKVEDGDEYFI
ncbi:MAG: FHA domain-containing protein, partial [Archangium sp.]